VLPREVCLAALLYLPVICTPDSFLRCAVNLARNTSAKRRIRSGQRDLLQRDKYTINNYLAMHYYMDLVRLVPRGRLKFYDQTGCSLAKLLHQSRREIRGEEAPAVPKLSASASKHYTFFGVTSLDTSLPALAWKLMSCDINISYSTCRKRSWIRLLKFKSTREKWRNEEAEHKVRWKQYGSSIFKLKMTTFLRMAVTVTVTTVVIISKKSVLMEGRVC
jgi:hypothetical protein